MIVVLIIYFVGQPPAAVNYYWDVAFHHWWSGHVRSMLKIGNFSYHNITGFSIHVACYAYSQTCEKRKDKLRDM